MKSTKSYYRIFFALALTACSTAKNSTTQHEADRYPWFPFSWYAADISGRHYDKLAILVPAKVNDLEANFTLQFDLGSNYTPIYGNTIRSYYPENELENMLIKSSKAITDAGKTTYDTKGLTYHFGRFSADSLTFLEDHGQAITKDSLYTKTSKHIGTLGADKFKDRILIIDYPNRRMCVLDTLDSYWERRTTFIQAQSKRGRLHIPLKIGGSTCWFLFDTGASLFPINTNKELWSRIVDNTAKMDTVTGNSWGEMVHFYARPIKEKVFLGKRLLKPSNAWYNENKRLQEFNKNENIDGLAGNAYFVDEVVVLDFKTTRFGIVD